VIPSKIVIIEPIYLRMLLTVIAVLYRIVINPLANLFQKQLTGRGQSALRVNAATYLALSVTLAPFLFFRQQSLYPYTQLPAAYWQNGMLGGLLGALGNGFLVKAVEEGELSVLGPINGYKAIVGMLIGAVLLREYPNLYGILGVLLIIGGSYFVLDQPGEPMTWAVLNRPAIRYRLAAMVLTGVEAVVGKKMIEASNVDYGVIGWCVFGGFFSLWLTLWRKPVKPSAAPGQKDWLIFLLLVLSIGGMQYATSYVFKQMNVGYALSFFQLSAILSIFLGHAVYGEAAIRRKLLGAVIMIAGSVLIFLMGGK